MPMESSNNTHNPSSSPPPPPQTHHERSGGGHHQEHHQNDVLPTGLRILCLHDAHSSASGLKKQLTMLGDRLYQKHGIDLVYINSPLCASISAGDTNRVWYESEQRKSNKPKPKQSAPEDVNSPENDNDNGGVQEQLLGLDASLCLLQQIWTSMPFWGILGIGQGAAIGSLLSLLPDVKPRAKFGIFIQGEALIQEAEQLVDAGEDWSCLHIIDPDVKTGTGGRLIQQFGGAVHQVSRNGGAGYNKKVMNIIGKFIIDQKKKMRQHGESRALALQNQLHIVEQQASRLIAQRIAENPPNVLMAVVAPKEVAAGGMKRRGPGEEGGGAPCPPEFLLRRDTRAHLDDHGTSSRVHPEEQRMSNGESNNNSNDNNGEKES